MNCWEPARNIYKFVLTIHNPMLHPFIQLETNTPFNYLPTIHAVRAVVDGVSI